MRCHKWWTYAACRIARKDLTVCARISAFGTLQALATTPQAVCQNAFREWRLQPVDFSDPAFPSQAMLKPHGGGTVGGVDLFQPSTHNSLISSNENSDLTHSGRARWASGIRTLTVVLFSGTPLMVSSPPSSKTRSRIPRIPSDLPAESSSSLIPLPLSWTSKTRTPPSLASRMFT